MKGVPHPLIVLLAACGVFPTASAELKLGSPFSDRMVVQHDRPLVIWGWDEPGLSIEITFDQVSVSATATVDGRWEAEIAAPDPGGPYEISIRGSETKTLSDVLSGEVWLASGQSNMGWPISRTTDAETTIAAANDPKLRFFKVPPVSIDSPQKTVDAHWEPVTPEVAPDLSGVAYFFAKRLRQELDVPVGVIQSTWGGSRLQAWVPEAVMDEQPQTAALRSAHGALKKQYENELAKWQSEGKNGPAPRPMAGGPQHGVSLLDNGMIHPLKPYPIRGVIWYQGESDAGMGEAYRKLFALLVDSWRAGFRNPQLPVYFAQLPNWDSDRAREMWPDFRYHQALSAKQLPYTDCAVLIDAGDPVDIHPHNKRTPGHRLAQLALAETYGQDIVPGGPKPEGIVRIDDSTVEILFSNVGEGLELRKIESTSPFLVTFTDGSEARAVPVPAGDDRLRVALPPGSTPRRITYADSANPTPTLFNHDGFPGTPFRLEIPPSK